MKHSLWPSLCCCLGLLSLSIALPNLKGTNRYPAYTTIPNGKAYYDSSGNPIQSFGGGFLELDGTYYWVGQDFTVEMDPTSTSKVNMYKSTDLTNWEKVGAVLTTSTPDVHGNKLLASSKVERPKLLFNAATGKYVMWAHWELNSDYGASEIITATADSVEGPYIITSAGHRRPGSGNTSGNAMGDRLGAPITDFGSSARLSSNTARPYYPVQADYPPQPSQYTSPNAITPDALTYVGTTYGQIALGSVNFDFTLKARVAKQTPFDRSAYDKYNPDYRVSTAGYIVRYPTSERSSVVTAKFEIGTPGNQRTALVAPIIHPGLDESSDKYAVLVNSGDAAFLTVTTDGAAIYFTVDGSTPSTSSTLYQNGMRISINGTGDATMTVKAIAVLAGQVSTTATQAYKVASSSSMVPIFKPVINFPSGKYARGSTAFVAGSMRIYSPSYGTVSYYTTDGLDPNPRQRGENIGYRSRDFTVWQDPQNGLAFLIAASDHIYFRLWQLSDDYTDVVPDREYDVFTSDPREAPALVRNGGQSGTYVYMITSSQSGYYPNQSQYKRTKDLTLGFSSPRDAVTGYRNGQATWNNLEPVGDPSTYYSQPIWIFDIGTIAAPVYIYVGDRNAAGQLYNSTYVFIPLTIDDNAYSVTGHSGTGLMTLHYTPTLQIDLKSHKIVPSTARLLSLNKPVNATAAVQLTSAQISAGTSNYSAQVANDGINFDVSPWHDIQQYYQPTSIPFFWIVDLQTSYELSWIGLSMRSVGGSDSVYRYTISCSNDGQTWTKLIDNTANALPGFTSHQLSGTYRYVRLDNTQIFDVLHNQNADWQKGVYEISVYGGDDDMLASSTMLAMTSTSSPMTS